jgi:hypothetical protein
MTTRVQPPNTNPDAATTAKAEVTPRTSPVRKPKEPVVLPDFHPLMHVEYREDR